MKPKVLTLCLTLCLALDLTPSGHFQSKLKSKTAECNETDVGVGGSKSKI